MRFTRIVVLCSLAFALLGAAACSSAGPETTWTEFVKAVSENRADDAMSHLDVVRMSQKMLELDDEMSAAAEMFGGPEGLAGILEGELRSAIEAGDFALDDGGASLVDAAIVDVDTSGDTSTLTIDSEGESGLVYLEKIDGTWKIVMFE